MKIEIEIRYPVLPESAEKFEDALREFVISFFKDNKIEGEIFNHLTGNIVTIKPSTQCDCCNCCGSKENLIAYNDKHYCETCKFLMEIYKK